MPTPTIVMERLNVFALPRIVHKRFTTRGQHPPPGEATTLKMQTTPLGPKKPTCNRRFCPYPCDSSRDDSSHTSLLMFTFRSLVSQIVICGYLWFRGAQV